MTVARLAIVGAGPTGTSLLERIVANATEIAPSTEIEVHLVDPFPPGAGRVWRHAQSSLMWMNSMAEDVTMFTDDTVQCEGPIVPGPALHEWARLVTDAELPDPDVRHEVRGLDGMTFPTRQLQSAYLSWVFDRVCAGVPDTVTITVHPTEVLDLTEDTDGRQRLVLVGQDDLVVDAVVLTLGHLDVEPPAEHDADRAFAARHHVVHVPPAYTADIALDDLEAGEPVIVRGLGLAFVDLMVLVGEGRGGRFVETPDGLVYEPSGREPVLHAGSRRGVPYRSKIGYRLQASRAPLPRFFDRATIERVLAEHERVEFFPHVWPHLAKDVAWGHYHELFHAHGERTAMSWSTFDAEFAGLTWDEPELLDLVARAVPDAADRFDVARLDRPLARLYFPTSDALQEHVRGHIEHDLERRADPAHSADLGAFCALLTGFGQLTHVAASGQVTPRSLVEDLNGWWFGFFSYFASGPPAPRLRQLLALSRGGVVRFLGADTRVERDELRGVWRATSASTDDAVESRALVEARLPASSVSRSRSPLVAALRDRAELGEQALHDPLDGRTYNTGKVTVDPGLRILAADGTPHARRFGAGIHTSRPAAGTFARPRTNALAFRQNDALARAVLAILRDARHAVGDDDLAVPA